MKIYFFQIDPYTKIIEVGITRNGKREVALVHSNSQQDYVFPKKTKEILTFSEKQTIAFNEFLGSGKYSVDFPGGIE